MATKGDDHYEGAPGYATSTANYILSRTDCLLVPVAAQLSSRAKVPPLLSVQPTSYSNPFSEKRRESIAALTSNQTGE